MCYIYCGNMSFLQCVTLLRYPKVLNVLFCLFQCDNIILNRGFAMLLWDCSLCEGGFSTIVLAMEEQVHTFHIIKIAHTHWVPLQAKTTLGANILQVAHILFSKQGTHTGLDCDHHLYPQSSVYLCYIRRIQQGASAERRLFTN